MKAAGSKDSSNGGPQDANATEQCADEETNDFYPGYKDVDAFTKVGGPCVNTLGPGQRGRSGLIHQPCTRMA